MEKPKLLSTNNIPPDILIGGGGYTTFECKDKNIYEQIERRFRGAIFHLSLDGRFYIKVDKQILKALKPYVE